MVPTQRANVIESHPDKGYKNILIGSHDLLTPFGDGINEKGLYFSTFADPNGVGEVASPMAGGAINGLSFVAAWCLHSQQLCHSRGS